jgi:hypothetical protein
MPRDPWDEPAPIDPWDEPDQLPLAPGESQDVGPPAPEAGPALAGATGPAGDAAVQQAPPDNAARWRDLLSKSKAAGLGAGQGALMGFGDEAAGAVGAVAEKTAQALGSPAASDKSFVDMYREGRDYSRKMHDEARAEQPWTYGVSQVAGGVGGAAGAGLLGNFELASRGAQAVKQGTALGAVSGLGGSTDDLTQGDVGGAAVDTGVGAGLGAATSWLVPKAVDALKNPIAKAKESIGDAMQWPQRAYEAVAERVGRTDMAQKSTSAAGDVAGPVASAQVKALRQLRDNADLGSELASTLRAKTEELGGIGTKLVSAMDPQERAQVAKAMAELLHTRGLTDVTPEFVGQHMDELARAAGLDLGDLTGNTFLRMANKRDPKWWVSAGEGVRKFWTSRGMAGEAMDPRMQQQFASNAGLADDFTLGKLDRMGRPMSDAGPGKYQFGVDEVHGKLGDPRKAALERLQARAEQRLGTKTDPFGRPAPIGQGGVRDNRVAQMPTDEQFASIAAEVRDHRIAQGANPDAPGKTLEELFPSLSAAGQGADASARLRDIATGRNFLQQKVLPIAGAMVGGGGGAGMGMLGVLSGAPLGAGAASKAPVVADAFGELGQGIAQSGRDAIKASVRKMASDPLKIQKLADVPGAVGNAARWALEKAKEPAAFAARSYVLSLQPEFRKMLADADGDASTPP